MTNASGSEQNTDKAARAAGRSVDPRRREVAPGVRRPRIPGLGNVEAAATSGAKNVVGGVRRASAGVAERGRAGSGRAAGGVRRASSGVAERGRAASGQVTRATTGAVDTGRTAVGEVTRHTAAAADTGRGTAGKVASTGADIAGGVVGAVGSTLRTGVGASLSFLIPKALALLLLIRRLVLMALEALKDLARQLRERATSASRRPDASGEGTKR